MKAISQAAISTRRSVTYSRALLFFVTAILAGCGRDNGLHALAGADATVGGNVGVGSGGAGGALAGISGGGGIAGSGIGGAMAQGGGSGAIQDGAVNDGVVSIDAICDFKQFWEDVKNATNDSALFCYPISDGSTGKFDNSYYMVIDDEGRIVDTSPTAMGTPRYSLIDGSIAPCPSYAGQAIQYECVPML
jgi:hypothetical protein